MKKKKKRIVESSKSIPLGGLEQIGMNITAFEYEDSIIVVDCGLSFPEDDMYGIDLVIPDITYLKDNIDKVKGFFITHGHEDHIGAIPYVLREINVPIYSYQLTNGIIEHKLREHNMLTKVKRKVSKIRTAYQSRLLPCGIHQDEPQYSGCGGSCHLLPGMHYWCTPETSRYYTPGYSEMPSSAAFR